MANKPSIPKGTRDFSPLEMARRNYIFDTVRRAFALFGYAPIETPAIENLSTLMGKYGEEGDKLLFKILNSGDFIAGVDDETLAGRNSNRIVNKISEKGLRYDLTVPFARYVVQHRNELQLPFKRYQIQPVWRADRPQKGRYREFYQCDADVVGSDSLNNEVELVQLIDNVFKNLGINVVIKINNRKILQGIAEVIGHPDKLIDITVAIDKIDKIGLDAVKAELTERGLTPGAIELLQPFLLLEGSTSERLESLAASLASSETGLKGVEEARYVLSMTDKLGIDARIELDVALARGLNYYTGAIFEVKALDYAIGSISGGGRYDNLTGIFGLPGISGVGVSFGADRIYDVMLALNLFPDAAMPLTRVMFINFGQTEAEASLKAVKHLRGAGISAEMYPDAVKMKKQMAFASEQHTPYVAIIGEDEIRHDEITLKDMTTGQQHRLTLSQLTDYLKK